MLAKLQAWIQQPTTITGISGVVGAVSAALTHQMTWVQAAPILAASLVAMLIPDNTNAKSAAAQLANALTTAIQHPPAPKP